MSCPEQIEVCDEPQIVECVTAIRGDSDLSGLLAAAIALSVARDRRPDMMVLEIGLPDRGGLAATPEVLAASPGTKVVLMLTVHDDLAYLRRAFDVGATGYLGREAADVELVQAIGQVVPAGSTCTPPWEQRCSPPTPAIQAVNISA